MDKIFIIIAAAAALAACDNQEHNIVTGPGDPNAAAVNTAGVVLPPAIAASKIYRCKDNGLVYIDWLSDHQSANFRASQSGTATHLAAAEPGGPLIAEGYALTGDPMSASISLTRPGKGSQSCKT